MKDGRASRIFDIRYFVGDRLSYLESNSDVTAYGRRMAWFLKSEEMSLRASHSLYISFADSLELNHVKITDEGGDWWHRHMFVGVAKEFPQVSDLLEVVSSGTVAVLKRIRPDASGIIEHADETVRKHEDDLRFLVRLKNYARHTLTVTSTIAAHPAPSLMYVSIIDKESGANVELPPVPTGIYFEVFKDASSIKIRDVDIGVSPTGEMTVQWSEEIRHGWPNVVKRPAKASRPYTSKIVRWP